MHPTRLPILIMVLLLVLCFALAADLDVRLQSIKGARRPSSQMLDSIMGNSRRMFANQFFVKADAYFHSGFYPTIFDNQESFQTAHMAEDAGAVASQNRGDETAFMGKPRDIIERFSRGFMPDRHTHLDEGGAGGQAGDLGEENGGGVREILPWLLLSTELDPQRIESYTVTAYWLRNRMGKVDEAEKVLRDGLKANPGSPAILYELGRIYDENRNDKSRARNIWEAALKNCQELKSARSEPGDLNNFMIEQICVHLAHLEESEGNLSRAIACLEIARGASVTPRLLQARIDELRQKAAAPVSSNNHLNSH
jgi:tetratricopeptide (TPR) repeat protein